MVESGPGAERTPAVLPRENIVRRSRIVRSIWAACLLLATANHARILARHGLAWNYGGVGAGSALYWSSLTIADPLTAALLLLRPKAGIVLTVVLITTNVFHNLAIVAMFSGRGALLPEVASNWPVISQMAFMLFVFASARTAWRGG